MRGRRRRAPDLAGRVTSLEAALAAGGGRLEPAAVARANAVLARTGQRMRLGADKTVVALVGATGSGKSSLFNALCGLDLAMVGTRRPTTSLPTACVWGHDEAGELLDWLDVPLRHRTERESVLDADREASLHGLVLLDLPDHDSTEMAHRLEVDRLVELVDLLVWVVDPQKYADEALHTGYLKRLVGHDAVMLVVLNQVDRLTPAEAETCLRDLRRLLDSDGLSSVRVLTTSARRGDGVDRLRTMLGEVVRGQQVVAERAYADVDGAVGELRAGVAEREPAGDELPGADELVQALATAAGVPVVLTAVAADYRRRGGARTGWPFTRWARRLRPDPLKRLRLGKVREDLKELTVSSLPVATPSQRARVDLAVRMVTSAAAEGLPQRWNTAVRAAVTQPGVDLADALDRAVLSVDLDLRPRLWWRAVNTLQMLLALTLLGGAGWLTALAIVGWLQLPPIDTPMVGAFPLPTLMLLGGLAGGLLLAVLSRWMVRVGARRRRNRIKAQLDDAVGVVAREQILEPVVAVLTAHRVTREALAPTR